MAYAFSCSTPPPLASPYRAYRPRSPQELSEYLLTILRHARVAEFHREFEIADVDHTANILKNANAALINLLFEPAR
jgi:hypothetical protein